MKVFHMGVALFLIVAAVVVVACMPPDSLPQGGARPAVDNTSRTCESAGDSSMYNNLMECRFSDGVVCVASAKGGDGMIVCDFTALHK